LSSISKKPTRFASSLLDILESVTYRRVAFQDQFDPVYRLRYEAYRRGDYISVNSNKIVFDEHDKAPNVYCYGVYIEERLISSIRFHHVTPEQRISPSALVFPDTLKDMLDQGISYVDPSRFTADYEASLAYPALPFLTLRVVAMASEYFDVKYCISSVRVEHAAFYKRFFGSKRMPGVGYYPGLSFPMHLYAAEVEKIGGQVVKRFPFMMSTKQEREKLFGKGGDKGIQMVIPTARQAHEKNDEWKKNQ